MVTGAQSPRIEIIPDGDEHPLWDEITGFVTAAGITLDPWQLRILWASLLRRGQIWAAFTVACCVPRQNGKNGILEARELVGARILGEKLQIHSAHLADTSMEGFRRLDYLLEANEWLSKDVTNIRRQNGHEQITFRGGNRIRFRTRTKGGGRGFSGAPVYFDEAMYLPEISYGAMLPVISAQPDPQVWQTGSAVDQAVMDDGLVFTRAREQALTGGDRIAWFEWSLDYSSPEDVPLAEMESLDAQASTNPALGVRITPEYVAAELRSLDPRTAAVERFGVGDWPRTDGVATVIDLDLWGRLADAHSRALDPVCFGFDVRPNRSRSVIVAVGRRQDDLLHLEVVDSREGVGWVVERLVELSQRHAPHALVCDGVGPASSLVPELRKRQIEVSSLDSAQMGQACGMFYDAVHEERVRHLGDTRFVTAIKGAATRALGDRWAWSRRNSTSDVSPLVAATIGVWAMVSQEVAQPFAATW